MLDELDLVQEDDQITHLVSLDDEFDTEETLSECWVNNRRVSIYSSD